MKLAITSLGFENIEDVLNYSNIRHLEVVPYKIKPWNELTNASVFQYSDEIRKLGITPYSFLSLFYGLDIHSFNDTEKVLNHLNRLIVYCNVMNIKQVVFGSPGLRKKVPGWEDSISKLIDQADKLFNSTPSNLLIEPVSSHYKAEYFTTIDEIVEYLNSRNYKNIFTMLDMHACVLENLDPVEKLYQYKDYIKHVHVNEPDLGPLKDITLHKQFSAALKKIKYDGIITFETVNNKFKDNVKVFEEIYQ